MRYADRPVGQLRDDVDFWEKQMDIYDDNGDYRAYSRAEMEHREALAALHAKLEEEGE